MNTNNKVLGNSIMSVSVPSYVNPTRASLRLAIGRRLMQLYRQGVASQIATTVNRGARIST
jgi:hypothetical protein